MCYDRIKSKIFLAIKGITKLGECHAISFFFTVVCRDKIIENTEFSNLLAFAEFSTEIERRMVGWLFWISRPLETVLHSISGRLPETERERERER